MGSGFGRRRDETETQTPSRRSSSVAWVKLNASVANAKRHIGQQRACLCFPHDTPPELGSKPLSIRPEVSQNGRHVPEGSDFYTPAPLGSFPCGTERSIRLDLPSGSVMRVETFSGDGCRVHNVYG